MTKNSTPNITEEGITVPNVSLPFGFTIELAIFIILSENFLILLTIRLYKKLKVVDLLILSLAVSDFVNAMLPLQILNIKAHFIISPWSQWLCGTFIWTTYTLRLASLSTVSLMSIEKAVLLFHPLKYYTQFTLSLTRKLILAAWVSSAIIATLPAAFKNNQMENKDVHCGYQPYQFGLEFGVFVEAIGMLHFVIVLGSYVALVVSSKGFRRRQKSMLSSQRKDDGGCRAVMKNKKGREETQGMLQARQLCRVMGYVVVLYYVTWLPFLIYNLHSLLTQSTGYNRKMGAIVGTFSLVAPILNPLLYVKMLSRYRKGVLVLLGRRITLGSNNGSGNNISARRNYEIPNRQGKSRAVPAMVTICEKEQANKQ